MFNKNELNKIMQDERVMFEPSCVGQGCVHPEVQEKNRNALEFECMGCPLEEREWELFEPIRRKEILVELKNERN